MQNRAVVVLSAMLLGLWGSVGFAEDAMVLTGKVTTRDNGLPLPGATVSIESLGVSATTDAEGRYSLAIPRGGETGKTVGVKIAAAGLAPKTWRVKLEPGSASQDFALSLTFQEEITVGSRAAGTKGEKAVPVDVIGAREIEATGLSDTMQVLEALVPSFNFPRTTIADGSASVRPATLRGLGPDQVLVLVNGKRRHTTALVHVNATVGRGSTGADLNAIPVSAIERIEVLRDGAAAQYGSDAIAGVINIVLKSGASPVTLSAKGGLTLTDQGVGGDSTSDGELADASASYGWRVGRGWVFATANYRDRSRTNRAAPDPRDQVVAGDAGKSAVAQPNHWVGDPETKDALIFLNAQLPLGKAETTFAYVFGGWGRREATAPGFFRRALDDRNHPEIYPLGFLPLIDTEVIDGSGTAGVRGIRSGWFWDISAQYGRNSMDFTVGDSLNASLGPTIPPNQTLFYAGTYVFDQYVANLDVSRQVEIGLPGPVNLAFGTEFRRESYQILPGEPASYVDGGLPNQFGGRAAPGAQVFPGLRPSNETDASRNNVAGYLDLEGDLLKWLRLEVAGRVENYSDFGSTADGKVTLRIEPHKTLVLRAGASTGFRAPSLAQSFFSATSTNFINLGAGLVPVEVGTFPVGSPQARALGAQDLEPEESVHLSGGVAWQPVDALRVTVDYYRIEIARRIVFSGNLTGPRIQPLLAPFGASSARFFTNAIDTRTQGLDLFASYRADMGGAGILRLQAAYNAANTDIVGTVATPVPLVGLENVLFDREQRRRIECGQPKDSARLSADWSRSRWSAAAHVNRYGEYCSPQNSPANDQTFSPKWITDLEVSYSAGRATVAVGGQNLFDVYPETQLPANSLGGIIRYPAFVPYGVNGRFLYARIVLKF